MFKKFIWMGVFIFTFGIINVVSSAGLYDNGPTAIDAKKLQEQLTNTPLTSAEAQKINDCIVGLNLKPILPGETPSAEVQRAIGECYKGTAYESLMAPLHEKIATVIDCGKDKLGVSRVTDVTRLAQNPTDKEIDIIKQCYVERTAPFFGVAARANVIAVGGFRDVAVLIYLFFTNIWHTIKRTRRSAAGLVMSSLAHLPIDLAIVRLINKSTKRTVRSTVSDRTGQYYLFADPGTYDIEATKPEHQPALQTITNQTPIIAETVVLEEIVKETTPARERLRRAGTRASSFVGYGAPIAGVTSAVLVPKWWIIALAIINILFLFMFRWFARRHSQHAFGFVKTKTGAPVKDAVVRVFETQYNKLVSSTISDGAGRYGVFVGQGNYVVRVEKSGTGSAEKTLSFSEPHAVTETFVL